MGITGFILIAAGIIVSSAAEATARGRIGKNSFVGIRVGYVMHSPAAWLAGHRAARVPTHIAGAIFAAGGLLVLLVEPSDEAAAGIAVGCCLAGLAVIIAAAVRANRAAELVVVQNADRAA